MGFNDFTIFEIEGEYWTTICTNCHSSIKKNNVPKYSLANGFDFGNRERVLAFVGIHSISLAERMLIQEVILIRRTVKVSVANPSGIEPVSLKVHVIATEIESKDILQEILFCQETINFVEFLEVHIIGKIRHWAIWKDPIQRRKFLNLQVDVNKVIKYRLMKMITLLT